MALGAAVAGLSPEPARAQTDPAPAAARATPDGGVELPRIDSGVDDRPPPVTVAPAEGPGSVGPVELPLGANATIGILPSGPEGPRPETRADPATGGLRLGR